MKVLTDFWDWFLAQTAGWKTKALAFVAFIANTYEVMAPSLDMSTIFPSAGMQIAFNGVMFALIYWARNQASKVK